MSETMSMVSSNSSKAGIFKHCMLDGCDGVKVSASSWSRHTKKDGHQGTQPEKCIGAECKLC